MYVKLNVIGHSGGGTALICVYKDLNYSINQYNTLSSCAMIIHNESFCSLKFSSTPPENLDNDRWVTYRSNVPFDDFCEQFRASEYNDPHLYHMFTHNCANAANHALKLAGINLPIGQVQFIWPFPTSILPIPCTILSPDNLYQVAKKYKIEQLNKPSIPLSRVKFKMDLACTRLSFWEKSAKNTTLKKNVTIIVEESQRQLNKQAHHAELYLHTLVKTIDLLNHNPSLNEHGEYSELSKSLKHRIVNRSVLNAYGYNLNLLVLSLLLFISQIDYDWQRPMLFLMLIGIANLFRAAHQETSMKLFNHGLTSTDTTLSKAMSELHCEIQKETGAGDSQTLVPFPFSFAR